MTLCKFHRDLGFRSACHLFDRGLLGVDILPRGMSAQHAKVLPRPVDCRFLHVCCVCTRATLVTLLTWRSTLMTSPLGRQLPLTFSIFCCGVGLKYCMKYGVENTTYSTADGNYTPYKQRYAWMVSISAGCALFCVTSSRYIGRNKQTPLSNQESARGH